MACLMIFITLNVCSNMHLKQTTQLSTLCDIFRNFHNLILLGETSNLSINELNFFFEHNHIENQSTSNSTLMEPFPSLV